MKQIKHAWCAGCGPAKTNCSTLCTIEDGVWTHVQGNPCAFNNGQHGSTSLCAKGNAMVQLADNPNRILYPMKRVVPKNAFACESESTTNTSDYQADFAPIKSQFKRITWDEALDLWSRTLKDQKRHYGAKSFGILSPQLFPVLKTIGRRFLNVHGSPNYLHSGICAAQRLFSRYVTIGGARLGAATNPGTANISKTRLMVNWGSNPENSGVNLGVARKRVQSAKRGMQIIDIRPMLDPLATHANEWVPLRPGTDCALALGILNQLIKNDWYDHDFVENWCTGFDELSQYVTPYTPAWTAQQCGISAEQVVRIAHMMGTNSPMAIQIGNGVGDQQSDGHWAVSCICLIEAITGNLGIEGGGNAPNQSSAPLVSLRPINPLSERLCASEKDLANGWMAGVADLVAPETPRWFQTPLTQESGPTSAYNKALQAIVTEDPYPLRCVFAQATNPLSATRQPQAVARALAKLDFYVVMDTVWNSSCAYADLVLPACTCYEASDTIAVKNGPEGTFIGLGQQITHVRGESRSDWQVYLDLAVHMGYADDFWGGSVDEMLRSQLEGTGISLEQLREQGYVFIPTDASVSSNANPACESVDGRVPAPDYKKMFANLPEGKVQCKNLAIGGKLNVSETAPLPYFPVYRGPSEGLAQTPDLAERYPLILSDVHAFRLCNHSYFHNIPILEQMQPYPWVVINPSTAQRFDVQEGDWVLVNSPHGSMKAVAYLFEGVSQELVMTKRGWNCFTEQSPWGQSESNALFSDDPSTFDEFHSGMGKQTLINIQPLSRKDAACAAKSRSVYQAKQANVAYRPIAQDVLPQDARSQIFLFDAQLCLKCWACEIACAQWHGGSIEDGRRHVSERDVGSFPQVKRVFSSVADSRCDLCGSIGRSPSGLPRCVSTCPTGALTLR